MKNNNVKFKFICLYLFCGIYFYFSNSKKEMLNDLTFENIEAIAGGESSGGNYRCYGWGDIDCHGYKVEKAYTGLGLD